MFLGPAIFGMLAGVLTLLLTGEGMVAISVGFLVGAVAFALLALEGEVE